MKYNNLFLDIGGNGVQYQINDGAINSFTTINKDKDYVLKNIANIANDNKINNISISSPGACNSKTGWIDGLSGIRNYGNMNIYDQIKSMLNDKETYIIATNDANCALAANLSNSNFKNTILMTIGTGIGGAYSIDGKIITGKNGYGGEFGYELIKEGGNVSTLISSNALVKLFNGKYDNTKDIYKHELKSEIFDEWITNLAYYIINKNCAFDPEVIFLSGGITNAKGFKNLIDSKIDEILDDKPGYTLIPNIEISNHDNDGIVGAKYILKGALNERK